MRGWRRAAFAIFTNGTQNAAMDKTKIGNVRAELARHQVRPRELASVLDLKPRTIHNRITGHTPWRVDELARVADYLGITVDELLHGKAAAA